LTDDHVLLVCTLQAAHQGLSMGDLGRAMKALGAKEALNLDGGPSTGLWGAGKILNTGDGQELNDVATALVVLPPGGEGVELR
jgi:exopolysaccharide biosynthesis protein